MKFRTCIDIPESEAKIGYNTKCLLMGSCFSDTIGKRMAEYKFPVMLNPFGTLFNPFSIAGNVQRLITGRNYVHEDLHNHNGQWLSFDHYTGFTHPDPGACLTHINHTLNEAIPWLKECRFLLLTFGTAFYYQHRETGKIVANCHKIPASAFLKKMASPEEIIAIYDHLFSQLNEHNPSLDVIFTLSPVRHWADGAENNQLSKSILHYSIHELMKRHPNAFYFPAYEIFIDELRDYRFYAADMLHPSETGTDYVWERFCETCINKGSEKIMAGVIAILKALGHRPLQTETTSYSKFVQNTMKQIQNLTQSYPFLDFRNEIAMLQLKG
jgi:hypothetical protein